MSKPARLGHQSEQPFQARALHPNRRAWLRAGMEVERRAYTEQRSSIDLAKMLNHPSFLLGHAKSDPDEIRTDFVDRRDVLGLLDGGQGPERGRAVARHDQAGMAPLKAIDQQFQYWRAGAVEVVAVFARHTRGAYFVKQVRAADLPRV